MKVLIVLNNFRSANGVASTIMNQYDALIEKGYVVDFLVFLEFQSPYITRIQKNFGKIYLVEKRGIEIGKMKRILIRGKYDIVHINQVNVQTVILSIISHYLGVKKLVFHSHNTKIPNGIKRKILMKICTFIYSTFADSLLACSEQAGKDVFGKKEFTIMKNSIDVDKFKYNYDIRGKIRDALNISNQTFVVGTVCRYARQKNPIFMIDIVNEILKLGIDTRFLWIGSAPMENDAMYLSMKNKVKELGIEDKMIWVGSKDDVYNWYSAMDAFIMPSLWEGLGISYIESQANSLPTFASDVVPRETCVTELIQYLPLDIGASAWANEISKCKIRNCENDTNYCNELHQAGYDIATAKYDLYKIYESMFWNSE